MEPDMNLIKTAAIPLMYLVVLPAHGTTLTLHYQETTEDLVQYYQTTIERMEDMALISFRSSDQLYTIEADANLAAQRVEIRSLPEGARVEIRREDNQITVIQDEETFTKQIDTSPWYATTNSLADFIVSDDEKTSFWTVSANFEEMSSIDEGMSVIQFSAQKKGREQISYSGIEIEALKVRVTFPGWRSLFWSADYWFDPDDGVLLRSEQVRGGPGTPVTVVELVDKKY
jgi:hypothetical protein